MPFPRLARQSQCSMHLPMSLVSTPSRRINFVLFARLALALSVGGKDPAPNQTTNVPPHLPTAAASKPVGGSKRGNERGRAGLGLLAALSPSFFSLHFGRNAHQ
jgi:hypothetical protein